MVLFGVPGFAAVSVWCSVSVVVVVFGLAVSGAALLILLLWFCLVFLVLLQFLFGVPAVSDSVLPVVEVDAFSVVVWF